MNGLFERIYQYCPVALQNLLVTLYGRKIRRERFGPEFDARFRMLTYLERAPWERIRGYQDRALRALIKHAYGTVPYYGKRWDALDIRPSDVRSVDDLPKLPVLTRADVIENREELLSTTADRRQLKLATTSGTSTGVPMGIYWDRDLCIINNVCLWRAREWGGVGFGRPYATLMGKLTVPLRQKKPPYWRFNKSWNQLLLSSYHISENTAQQYVDKMRESGTEMLEAYPSAAYLLARYMEAKSLTLPMKSVLTSSEPLLPIQRELIEERFECRVFDAYGQAERVAFASECEEHKGLHIFEEYGVVEILGEDFEPVAPGEMGQIVATGLHNMAMPLIRYAIGDRASLGREPCPCGRTLRLLSGITGRAEDIVVTPTGRMVPGHLLSYAFKGVGGLVRFQMIQERPDRITVRLVVGDRFSRVAERDIRRRLTDRLGGEVELDFEYVDEISTGGRGKYPCVVSRVPLRWGELKTANLSQELEPSGASGACRDADPKGQG